MSDRSPEGILLTMRKFGAPTYLATWNDEAGNVMAACLIVDDSVDAPRLVEIAREMSMEPGDRELGSPEG